MPLYDIRCKACDTTELNVVHPVGQLPQCKSCGGSTEHVWSRSAPVHIFQEGFYEHAADEMGKVPYFSSRRKYKAYLKENGMYADYVEGTK